MNMYVQPRAVIWEPKLRMLESACESFISQDFCRSARTHDKYMEVC